MTPHDWLWLIPAALGAVNAWQNKSIQAAVLALETKLVDRIAKAEGETKVVQIRLTQLERS